MGLPKGQSTDTLGRYPHDSYGDSNAERAARAGNIEGWQHFCAKLAAVLDVR